MATNTQNTKCGKCHRVLTSATSLRRGYGPGCWANIRRERAAQQTNFEAHQVDSATELIEDGAIVPSHDGVWIAVSTKGDDLYACTTTACSCPAGTRGKACYHQLAVRILATVRRSRPAHALAA